MQDRGGHRLADNMRPPAWAWQVDAQTAGTLSISHAIARMIARILERILARILACVLSCVFAPLCKYTAPRSLRAMPSIRRFCCRRGWVCARGLPSRATSDHRETLGDEFTLVRLGVRWMRVSCRAPAWAKRGRSANHALNSLSRGLTDPQTSTRHTESVCLAFGDRSPPASGI